ncbi:MAG: 3-keto-5-aminohexanoate cleavage protein [Spirochaetes bacterium]|nr:3-keto-5-aminohexanoate cleavage protein [Spirochaetota bacterium]
MGKQSENKNCLIFEGKLALPYSYFAGRVGSKFITTLRDKNKILGVKCPTCNTVFIPPRQVCNRDFTDIRDNWVELGNSGTVVNFTVVRYDDRHLPRKAPFVMALIKLEGADTPFTHILEECKIEDVKIGMAVEAVFAAKTTNTVLDIDHFKPVGSKAKAGETLSVHERSASRKQWVPEDEPEGQEKRRGARPDITRPVILTAALTGAATMKNQNPNVPYTPAEFADEAYKCWKAGAAMVHVHARADNGMATHEHDRIRATHDAIKQKCPDLIVNLSSAVGMGKTAEQRISQIVAVKPEMASLNTNTMNFSIVDRKTGKIFIDFVFENTFTMLQDFGRAMEENGVKPEIEVYDMGGLDNTMLIAKQGFFTDPINFNFVWGVAGGQAFRADAFVALMNALPPKATFTTCGVGTDEFPAIMQSCILGGNMRVGLEDNIRMPNGELAKGSWELVEVAARIAECLGRPIATTDEARLMMGLKKK